MSPSVRISLLLIIDLLLSLASKAQSDLPGYSIANYNGDNALPQNSINDMAFDRNGFLWLATEMGVVRFDGKNFREYNTRNSPAMTTDRCNILREDIPSGTIVMEPQFAIHRYLKVTADYQIKEDTALGANPYQFFLFSYANLYKKWAAGDTGVFDGLFNRLYVNRDMLAVNENQAYVRKDLKYYFLDEKTADIRFLSGITGHAPKIQFAIGDVFVVVDTQNHLYAFKDGIRQNITGSSRLMALMAGITPTGPYPNEPTLMALRDNSHTFLVHKGDILLANLRNGQLDFDTLAANTPIRNISCLTYDQRYKTLYVGTATSGLYILKKQDFQRLYFSSDNYVINSLYGQTELSDGNILTSSGILNRNSKLNVQTLGSYDRPAFLRSSDGYIWYSAYGWVRKADISLKHVKDIVSLGNVSLFGIWITSFVEMNNNDILCCSQRGRLYRIRNDSATLLFDAGPLLKKNEMNVILPVGTNELWVGTGVGLYSYDMRRGTFSFMPELGNANVRALHKARDGSIWVGTYGQGFYKYTREHFVKMPMDPAGNLATAHCFMEDRQGNFWIPTNRGLYRVAKSQLDEYATDGGEEVFYYYFDKTSGFATNEFNGGCSPCGIVTLEGRFSLPSLDGLIQFDPDSVTVVPPDHPVFIEHLTADEKKSLSDDNFSQDQDGGPLVFSISSPYFGNPANLHLEYSIGELDNHWHPVNHDGRLVLTGLRQGSYTLNVRKQEGYAQYAYKTVRWTILPYWYETIWVRVLATVVVVGILLLFFWLRYTRQVKRAEKLEQKVAERTEALSESNRVKEKMIAIILHDLRSPLRFLHMLAVYIHDNHQKVPRSELDEMLLKFQNATQELFDFAQDFVVWTNAQKESFVIRKEKIVLREIVEEIVSLYETGADIRNNTVLNLVPPSMTLVSDPHILKLLIRNLTDNANKYTLNGEIKIEADDDDDVARLTITDTGRSMENKLIADILNNNYQRENENHGFGYKIILELLAKIQGRLTIETPGATGNRITLLFAKLEA